MNIIKKTIPVGLIITVTGAFSPISAISEEIPARGPIPFTAFDKDGNGCVTEAEFNSVRAERRSQMGKRGEMSMAQGRGMRQAMGPGRGMGRNMPAFSEFDLDGDGKIAEMEFNEARAKRISERARQGYAMRNSANAPPFSNIDTNGDGAISAEEFTMHQTQHRQQMQKRREMSMAQGRGMRQGMGPGRGMGRNMPAFSEFDLDGDGKIAEMEFNEARARRISERAKQGYPMRNIANAPPFSNIDTNGDGAISAEEFTMHQTQHRQQMQKRGEMSMAQGRGVRQGMGPGRGMGRNMPAFSEFDLNGDGKIAEMEFNEARARRISERAKQGYPMRNIANAPPFSNIDTNGDGAISAEEFTKHQSQHRRQRGQ